MMKSHGPGRPPWDLGICIGNTLFHPCWEVGFHFYYFFPIWKANRPNWLLNTPMLPPHIANATCYLYFLYWVKITQIFILTHFANQEDDEREQWLTSGEHPFIILPCSSVPPYHVPSRSAFPLPSAFPAHSTAQPRFIALLQYLGLENPTPFPAHRPEETHAQ